METASVLVPDADEAGVLRALQQAQLVDGDTERHNGLVYFRLPPPERVAWKGELMALTGALEPEPGPLWVTHPFECWIAGPLSISEPSRDHLTLPARVVDSTGARGSLSGVEVRTQPANAPYLLLALSKAGFGRPLVRILD